MYVDVEFEKSNMLNMDQKADDLNVNAHAADIKIKKINKIKQWMIKNHTNIPSFLPINQILLNFTFKPLINHYYNHIQYIIISNIICSFLQNSQHTKNQLRSKYNSNPILMFLKRINKPQFQLLSNLTYNLFSSKIKLSTSAQKAVWSTQFIREIIQPKKSQKYDVQYRLNHRFSEIQIKSSKYTFNSSIRKEELEKFTKGIVYNSMVFNQKSIQNSKIQYNDKQKLLKFYPNTIITKTIFNILLNPNQNSLISGLEGNGKSFSILLFLILSQNIHKYEFQAHNDKKKQKQLNQLKDDKLIFYNIPKYWYLSLLPQAQCKFRQLFQFKTQKWKLFRKQQFLFDFLKNQILNQAKQLSQKDRNKLNKCQSLDKFSQQLTKIYKQMGKQQHVIIDQIQKLSNIMRQWNNHCVYNIQYPVKGIGHHFQQSNRSKFQSICQHGKVKLQIIKQFQKFGLSNLLFSSSAVQKDILTKNSYQELSLPRYYESSLLTFSLEQQGKQIKKINLNQNQENKKEKSKFFYESYWYQLEKYFIQKNYEEKIRKQLKLKYLKLTQNLEYKQYCNISLFQTFLQQKSISLIDQSNKKKSALDLRKIIEDFEQYCLDRISKKFHELDSFIWQGRYLDQRKRRKFLQQLYSYSQFLPNQNQKIFLSFDAFQHLAGQQMNKILLQNIRYQYHLGIQIKSSGIQFIWTPKQYLKMAYKVVYPQYNCYYKKMQYPQLVMNDRQELEKDNNLLQKRYSQQFFKYVQKYKSTIRFLIAKKCENSEMRYEHFQIDWQYKIIKKIEDQQKRGRQKMRDIIFQKLEEQCGRQIINIILQSKNKSQFYVKSLKEYQSKSNKTFHDCNYLILSYSKIINKFKIIIFDYQITTKTLTQRQKQAKKVFQNIANLFNQTQINKIQINYIIMCRKNQCKDNYYLNQMFQVSYSPLEDVKINRNYNSYPQPFSYSYKLRELKKMLLRKAKQEQNVQKL